MMKNVMLSSTENDVLTGINADNYYVFEGKYGNDTVKTKGNENTLQFDENTQYYFTAEGNNLVMHTETNATEFDKQFWYNGVFTNEEYRAENNKSVSELYIVNGEIKEEGTDDQRIGDKYLLKIEEDKFSRDLYVDSSGYVYNYDDGSSEKLDPSTPLYVDGNGDITTDSYWNNIPKNTKFYLEYDGSEGQYQLTTNATDYYGQSNTEIELIEHVTRYEAQDGDMYYNPVTKEFTTDATHNLLPEGAKLLSECYLPIDGGYFSTQEEDDYELIGDRKVYIQSEPKFNENYYPNDYDHFYMSFSGYVEDGDYEIDPTKTYMSFTYDESGYIASCCFIDAETAIGDNTLVKDLTENLVFEKYWLNNALTNISTHSERNIPISELYLVDGEIKESGTPEQLIGDKTLYEFNGKYYTDAPNTGDGTVTITDFLKGKIDVNVNIGDVEGLNLADMVNNSYILYDKSDATNKQTIKAHTNWNDKVIGSDFNDKIYGGNYNDKLYGGAGNDVIYTRNGNDEVYGEDGNDTIYLNGQGTKVVDAGSGDDKIYSTDITADKHYMFKGNYGNDTIITKGDKNTLLFDNYTKYYFTAEGNNLVMHTETNATEFDKKFYYNGEFTNEEYRAENNKSVSELYLVDGEIKESGTTEQLIGDKTLYEFNGKYYTDAPNTGDGTVTVTDFLKGKIDVNVNIGDNSGNLADMVKNSYILYDKSDATKKQTIKAHTNWNDKVIGSDFNDKIYGGNYNDKLYGGAGNDVIYTRNGNDEVYGEDGNDTIYLNGQGTKVVDAGSGDDKIYLTAKNISADITAGSGDDKIYIQKSVLEDTVLNFDSGSGNDIVAVSKKVDVSNLTLNIENFDKELSKFIKLGNNLIISSGDDSVTLSNYFVKGYNVSSALLEDKTLAKWVENSELYITSNSKTTKGTVYNDVIDVGSKVKSVSSYAGDDVICSNYQKITINGGDGDDTFNFINTDNVDNYTVLFNITKEGEGVSAIGNALYVVADDAKKLSYGITLKNVEKVEVNGAEYAPTDEVIESVQNWLNSANKGKGYDSVADAISHKCNVQELIAAFNPQVTPQEQIV